METTSLEGVDVFTGFSHAQASGWAVAVGAPRATLNQALWRTLLTTLAIGAALLAVSLALAASLARRITAPIVTLARFARTIHEEALPAAPIVTGLREVDEAALALYRDAAGRSSAEQSLKASQARYRLVVRERCRLRYHHDRRRRSRHELELGRTKHFRVGTGGGGWANVRSDLHAGGPRGRRARSGDGQGPSRRARAR